MSCVYTALLWRSTGKSGKRKIQHMCVFAYANGAEHE